MKWLDNLNELVKKYPNYEVVICVDDELFTGDHGWYQGSIATVEVGLYYLAEERILDDMDDIAEYFEELLWEKDISEEELERKVQDKLSKEPIKDVIYVRISTP